MNAYILIGGQSKRMGTDKALILLNGQSMTSIIAQKLLQAGCTQIFLVGKKNISIDLPQIHDSWKDHHPLYGVETALAHCSQEQCIITPCDIPFVSIEVYQQLLAQKTTTVLSTSTRKQPLLGLFLTSKRAQAQAYAQQQRSVMSFVENEACIVVPDKELHNINHPQDLKEDHDHR